VLDRFIPPAVARVRAALVLKHYPRYSRAIEADRAIVP